jgi:hypothetical protein
MMQDDLRNPQRAHQLTSDMMVFPYTVPGSQGGVVTDGTYDIWGSVGRIVYGGLALNRTDADRVERGVRAAAEQFAP